MKIYKYDSDKLVYRNVTKNMIGAMLVCSLLFTSIVLSFVFVSLNRVRFISQETKAIILNEATKANEFTPERLREYILELNIKWARIVYAQARLESGNYQSNIFKTNHNLFGMRVATKRPSTNKGEELGFAYYDNWKESVQDYAMFSAAYLNNIKTEDEYYEYLRQNYDSQDKGYVDRLKAIVAENNIMFAKK